MVCLLVWVLIVQLLISPRYGSQDVWTRFSFPNSMVRCHKQLKMCFFCFEFYFCSYCWYFYGDDICFFEYFCKKKLSVSLQLIFCKCKQKCVFWSNEGKKVYFTRWLTSVHKCWFQYNFLKSVDSHSADESNMKMLFSFLLCFSLPVRTLLQNVNNDTRMSTEKLFHWLKMFVSKYEIWNIWYTIQ